MGEEIRFPSINIPRALKLSPFIIFAVNGAFQWFLVGITPVDAIPTLADASAPYAEAMMSAGILGCLFCCWRWGWLSAATSPR